MRLLRALLCLPMILAACNKPHPADTSETPVVVFTGSGFSLEPGPGWLRLDTRKISQPIQQLICQPALTTKGVTIQVAQVGDRISEEAALAGVAAAMEADELAVKDSLTKVDFQSDSGVKGKIIRYTRHTAPDPKRVLNILTQYLVRNSGGRWVSIGAHSDTVELANEVDAMVKRTLREVPRPTPTPRPK